MTGPTNDAGASTQRSTGGLDALQLPIEDGALPALHHRLVAAAARDGLVEVAYRTLDSPVGPLLLASSAMGLVRIAFEREGFERVLTLLARAVSPRILEAPARLDQAATELDEYFTQRRRTFGLALDDRLSSGFRAAVQRYLPQIPYGQTLSYGEVAASVGNPKAVRAVGTACATNPLPIVVPCHRVLRADGGLGGYLGGPDAKCALLTLEAAAVA